MIINFLNLATMACSTSIFHIIYTSSYGFHSIGSLYKIDIIKIFSLKVTFAPNLAKKISTNFYYLSLLFQLSVSYSENFKEIKY